MKEKYKKKKKNIEVEECSLSCMSVIYSSLRFLSYQISLQNSLSGRVFGNDEEVIGTVNELITTREQFCEEMV